MTIPVWVEQRSGTFTASVPGAPGISVQGETRELAVAEARSRIRSGLANGQLVMVDVEFVGVSGLAGTEKDDPSILEIAIEAYRLRELEKSAEMAEYDRP